MEKEIFLLKSKFFLPFKPATGIRKLKIPLYKVVALNVGDSPANQVLLNKLTDDTKSYVSYFQLENVFLNHKNIDAYYAPLGYACQKHDKYVLLNRRDQPILTK